ncbi:MAG: hypothetical protein WC297_02605 [Candidatus Paceibacterota bacterium]|jgi:hypothetical protein
MKTKKPFWKICANFGKHSGTGNYHFCERCGAKGQFTKCGQFKKATLPCFGKKYDVCRKKNDCEFRLGCSSVCTSIISIEKYQKVSNQKGEKSKKIFSPFLTWFYFYITKINQYSCCVNF